MPDVEIPLSRPDLGPTEEALVLEVLRSGRLSMGPRILEFERDVALVAGRRHGVAVSSGTAGLHLALLALGIGPGDEIVTTPFSFIASSNCILYAGATPVFVDICPRSLNMDPRGLEGAITPRTKAILAVETFANPAHMEAYESIAARHEVPLVEDCCEALGTTVRGRACGSFGRAGVFAFYPNKQITTGEGGVIVTDDDRLADLCRSLRNHGRTASMGQSNEPGTGSWLAHDRVGYNYRMSEIHAAIGVGQMRRLRSIVERRREVATMYINRLSDNPSVILPTIEPECEPSWFVFVVRLTTGFGVEERDRIIRGMRNHEIGCSNYFPCIHLQPPYAALGYRPGSFPIAESVSQRTIALPFHASLTRRDVDLVCQTLELMISRESLSRS
ncbi:MAG: DegT/DnrJ/EryC1/StrS family aminotransferase [Phycisphaeraceae bacterium]|nr:DegT/DnrJ/EryC1/StrS family aminotransferase [Phycisphaeraceae bacterium]